MKFTKLFWLEIMEEKVDDYHLTPRRKFLNGARCADSNFMQWGSLSREVILNL